MKEKIIYYSDPLNDNFSPEGIEAKVIDEHYVYLPKSRFKRFTHIFWYRIVAKPIAWCFLKLKFRHKIIGAERLKAEQGGYFLYGNHTQTTADAFIPTMLTHPRDVYVIVHPDNVSIPILGHITPSLGAIPLPSNLGASLNFVTAVKTRLQQNCPICVYPEAHIWPYYTGIRPFLDKGFSYPVKLGTPVYCFTNTYQKHGRGLRIVSYIDGPFTADPALSAAQQRKSLRDQVYAAMVERAKNSNIEKIRYIYRGTE